MGEKRLECLAMLQIYRSDTLSIDAVIDRFATAVVLVIGRVHLLL